MIARKSSAFRTAIKPCETCAAPLVLQNTRDLGRKRFCSPRCKGLSQAGRRAVPKFSEARKCVKCGIDYIAAAKRQRYCSARCSGYVSTVRKLIRDNSLKSHLGRLRRYPGRGGLSQDFLEQLFKRQDGKCALSGIVMTWDIRSGRVQTNISLDRISSYAGYAEDNVQLVCRIVNIMKNNLGQLEFLDLCRKITERCNAK